MCLGFASSDTLVKERPFRAAKGHITTPDLAPQARAQRSVVPLPKSELYLTARGFANEFAFAYHRKAVLTPLPRQINYCTSFDVR
jgi:hypothetical protein